MASASTIEEVKGQYADPRWRLSNLYTITDKSGNAIPFRPNDAQLQFLDDVHDLNIILKARQLGFCLDPETRVLTADLRWSRIVDLRPGQEVVAVDEEPERAGRGQARRMRTGTVIAAVEVHRKAYRITFDDGRTVVCTGQHPWLSKKVGSGCAWRKIEGDGTKAGGNRRLKPGTFVRWVTKPWDAPTVEDGWFGGMLDGEGSIANGNTRASLNVSQRRGPVWDRLVRYCGERGYNFKVEGDEKLRHSKYGHEPTPKVVIGRMDEMFRAIGQTRPTRFLGKRFWEGRELPGKRNGGVGWAEIVSIEPLGEQSMVDLQTTTGTYIAEGFVSHNTTLCCLIYLDAGIFKENTRAGVIAHKMDDAKVIFRDKVKFPYDHLPPMLKDRVGAKQDSADTLTLANNSSIRVSTSMRSGTLQYLHVSEFGKLCAQFPERAREVVTGALNTIEVGQFVVIESTAEGQDGAFYQMTQTARAKHEAGAELTPLDFKFHFFPWYEDKNYALRHGLPLIPHEDEEYFGKLESELGITLTREQRAWYVKKAETQGGDMRREYPSTPDEAFEQALEGAYFSKELLVAAKQKRIGGFPFVPNQPVNTFWDLGRNDFTVIWLHQFVEGFNRWIGYYENSGEYISHYIAWIREWARDRNAVFGDHFLPHDGDRQDLWLPEGTMRVMEDLKFRPRIVRRPQNKIEAINIARGKFASCVFDEAGCKTGLKRLKMYRKEWDDLRSVWKDRPHHDDASHGADGFMTFTGSDYMPPKKPERRSRYSGTDAHSTSWMAE